MTGAERTAGDGGGAGPAGSVGTWRGRTSSEKPPRCFSREGAGGTRFTAAQVTLPAGWEAGRKKGP